MSDEGRERDDWRELHPEKNVPLNPADILERLEEDERRSFHELERYNDLRKFLKKGYLIPESDYGLICDALVDMGEDLGEPPLEGTDITGPPGKLFFFEDGNLRAKKTEINAYDFKKPDNGKESIVLQYYTEIGTDDGTPTVALSAMNDIFESSMEKVADIKNREYEVEITGEDLKWLYLTIERWERGGDDAYFNTKGINAIKNAVSGLWNSFP